MDITEILKKHDGVVFADEHPDPAIVTYLKEQMPSLAQAGVKVMFVEMFMDTDQHKNMLNEFNRNAQSPQSVAHMEEIIGKLEKQYPTRTKNDYLALFKAARENGISIVGIEPEKRDYFKPIGSANKAWAKLIGDYRKKHPSDKFIVFGGALHTQDANQLSGSHECDQAVGVDNLLGIPCVSFGHSTYVSNAQPLVTKLDEMHYSVLLPNKIQADRTEILQR